MDQSMSVIDDDNGLDRILENTNLHEYKLIDLPLEQLGDLSQENTDVGMATESTSRPAP